jgi:hypothetical protein
VRATIAQLSRLCADELRAQDDLSARDNGDRRHAEVPEASGWAKTSGTASTKRLAQPAVGSVCGVTMANLKSAGVPESAPRFDPFPFSEVSP